MIVETFEFTKFRKKRGNCSISFTFTIKKHKFEHAKVEISHFKMSSNRTLYVVTGIRKLTIPLLFNNLSVLWKSKNIVK